MIFEIVTVAVSSLNGDFPVKALDSVRQTIHLYTSDAGARECKD